MDSNIEYYVACPEEEPYWDRYTQLLGEGELIKIPHRKFKLKYYLEMLSFVKKNNIDIIHSHGKGAGIYSRLLKVFAPKNVNIVHTFHGIHLDYKNFINKIYIFIERFLSYFTDSFICVSDGERDKVNNVKLVQNNKLNVIVNGVEIPRDHVVNNNQTFNIVSVTRFDNQKNSKKSIEIMETLIKRHGYEDSTLTFIGQGPQMKELQDYVKMRKLERNIIFFGPTQNVIKEMQKYNMYLSSAKWEGMPLAVLEAMSVGLPAVLSNVVGNRDIVEHGKDGYLYELDDTDKIVDLMVQLKDEKWIDMSTKAREKIVSKYSVQQMVKGTKQIYSKISGVSK
ncbi:alpha(1,3)rhamnosyltransferase EpsG [Bacillus thuringiensis serovar thuringiensis str. T01001]|nr:alpha(1,3)rhamnosyltransferase EpsG [Bacillus thuringiensis Bt407]EEM32349.1 alpha(1,3)rhamnosyltransferase EpsG [Bacillus thuringiensis serovar thuringiensis str. T01001]EEM63339.1 alpha(1,3)rhamnosyltransferase EpsG [Bacillus thuringiensis serovar berliner ATCC 10792]